MVILFPGQGSQFVGMGERLFNKFFDLKEQASQTLGYPIEDVCLKNSDALMKTQFTQPAIFVVSALMYLEFLEKWNDPHIHFLIGHSLGEYTALFAAGAFDFKSGVELVKKRGELMQLSENGAMAAIIGMKVESIEDLLNREKRRVHIANYNSSNQTVISGNRDDIMDLQNVFLSAAAAVRYHVLPVTGAFHSPFMNDAAGEFRSFLENFQFKEPKVSVIANWNTSIYTAETLVENLVKQISYPVLWDLSMQKAIQCGQTMFYEVGPRNVLSKLIKNPPT